MAFLIWLFGGTEQPRRADEQKQQQDRERGDILERRTEQHDGERLGDAKQNTAGESAERAAEPSDNRRDKAGDRKGHADVEGGILRWRNENAGEGAERGAK